MKISRCGSTKQVVFVNFVRIKHSNHRSIERNCQRTTQTSLLKRARTSTHKCADMMKLQCLFVSACRVVYTCCQCVSMSEPQSSRAYIS